MANTLKFGNENWATKEDSILAYNDENDNFKPLPFTTSRASTATRVNKSGLIETVASGIPRVDYLGNTKGFHLLEPQSTNVVPYSQVTTGWTLSNVTEIQNALISPDGTLNASKFTTSALAVNIKFQTVTVNPETTYTYSFYCNYVGGDGLQGRFYDNTNGQNIEFYNYMSQIEQGKWTRVTRTFTTPVGCTNIQIWYLALSSTFPVIASYWGAQLEQGSYASSYIPNFGTALGVTRLADTASQTVPSGIINSSEGVLYAEISALSNEGDTYRTISLNDGSGTITNRILIGYTDTNNVYAQVNNTVIGITGVNSNLKVSNKLAVVYNGSVAKLFFNGTQVGTGITTAPTLTGLDNITSSSGAVTSVFEGKIKDLKVYNTALTDAELVTLTRV